MTTPKGERRRTAIVAAAARVIVSDGPAALTHRRIADEAKLPLASTTYYFSDLDELVASAGTRIADTWAQVAERVADRAESRAGTPSARSCADDVIAALLPRRVADTRGHYEHLVGSGRMKPLARAFREGRARLDAAITRILRAHHIDETADLVIAVVDGAVVSALNEGRPIHAEVRRLVDKLLGTRR